jgi:hypothetical protein
MLTTQKQIREAFWIIHPQFKRKGRKQQNDYPADIRMAFIDYVEHLSRDGQISDKLRDKVTL